MKVSINKHYKSKNLFLLFIISFFCNEALASNDIPSDDSLFDLPIETLLSLEVTSVSKKSEKVSAAPAAIFVITQNDIKRSGTTSIPEALRMAPGIQVARIDSNKWAISARGFNRQFSNKLLVLIDGRSVYTPLFSGVYWDEQDTLLEDIERIEVIRGPGATLWGANAVNGVINIITKNAANTQGKFVSTSYGNHERGIFSVRHGGKLGNNSYYRIYAKNNKRDEFITSTETNSNDDWRVSRSGFRIDLQNARDNSFILQGDAYDGEKNYNLSLPALSGAGAKTNTIVREKFEGGNILGKWNKKISSRSETSLQIYLDYISRISRDVQVLDQKRSTLDVDFQHTYNINDKNEIIWGTGFRFISDDIGESQQISYFSDDRQDSLYSAFVQDKINLYENKWFLTIGSKFEHNDYTGYEYQPSIRTSWIIDPHNTLWGAISRAVRTPSRNEADIILANVTFAPNVFASQIGTRSLNSEDMVAYEIGYKTEPTEKISLDFASFINIYDDLRTTNASGTNGTLVDPTFGNTVLKLPLENKGSAESYGFEFAGSWDVTRNWKLATGYSFLSLNLHVDRDSGDSTFERDEGRSAKNIYSLRSMYDFSRNIEWDNAIYYVDNLSIGIDSYIRFDSRIGWRPIKNLELSLVGQNLFDDWHQEFDESLYATPSQIGRSVYCKATYLF